MHLHCNNKVTYICSRTPTQGCDFTLKLPLLSFASYSNFPKAHNTFVIAADSPCAVGTDTNASGTTMRMTEADTPVIWEWLETIWTW